MAFAVTVHWTVPGSEGKALTFDIDSCHHLAYGKLAQPLHPAPRHALPLPVCLRTLVPCVEYLPHLGFTHMWSICPISASLTCGTSWGQARLLR